MIRVGVVRGGISDEYEVSLKTGESILEVLKEHHADKYIPIDIIITRDGEWLFRGRPIQGDQLHREIDVIFNALHGTYGEDGQIQKLLDSLHIPYTGSTAVPSAIAMHKKLTKDRVREIGVRVADEYMIPDVRSQVEFLPEVYFKEHVQNIFLKFPPPWVVKPVASGSSVGVSIAKTRGELLEAIRKISEQPTDIMVEQYVQGREATVAVTDHFRGEKIYSFLPIEICPPPKKFFDFESKYNGQSKEISPGRFTDTEKKEMQDLAKKVHEHLGLRHYSRSDFIVSPKGIYFLEVNTLPGMTKESLLPKSLQPVSSSFKEFLHHILDLALGRKP